MTVAQQVPSITYAAAGAVTVFAFPFRLLAAADLTVTLNGSPVTGFTVNLGDESGGSITFAVAPTGTLVLRRTMPASRDQDYQTLGNFSAADVDEDFDRAAMLAQQVLEQVGRTFQAPAGTAGPLTATIVAGQPVRFNAGGNGIENYTPADVAGNPTLQSQLLDSSSASTGSGMVAHNYARAYGPGTIGAKLKATISLSEFSGATDYDKWTAFIAAINASTAPGVHAIVTPGAWSLASASLASVPLVITRDKVVFEGDGYPSVTVTGVAQTLHVLGFSGRNQIALKGIDFFGNSVASAYTNGVALAFTNGSTADIEGFEVEDCGFDNFQGPYWVYVECLGTKAIRGVRVRRGRFRSRTGNSWGPTDITKNAAAVGIIGHTSNGTGFVQDVYLEGFPVYADYIKTGVQLFYDVRDADVSGVHVHNAGVQQVTDDKGAYAFMSYDSSGNARRHIYRGCRAIAARSCGFYMAGRQDDMQVLGCHASGTTDTSDGTLPKGGFVYNGTHRLKSVGNVSKSHAKDGFYWQPSIAGDVATSFVGDTASGCSRGLHVQSAGAGSWRNLAVSGGQYTENTTGIAFECFTSATAADVVISGGSVVSQVASSVGISVTSPDASYKLSSMSIGGGIEVGAVTSGITCQNFQTGVFAFGQALIKGNHANEGLHVGGTYGLAIDGLRFSGQTSGGYCVRSASARGTLRNVSFDGCADAQMVFNSGGEDLGRSTPTWVPTGRNAVVQNLLAAEAGAASSKYVLREWWYDTSGTPGWRQQRMLTGN